MVGSRKSHGSVTKHLSFITVGGVSPPVQTVYMYKNSTAPITDVAVKMSGRN